MEEIDFIIPNETIEIGKNNFKPLNCGLKTIPMKSFTLKKIEKLEKEAIEEYLKK